MKTFKLLFKRPKTIPSWAPWSLGIFSALGFIDATYLAVEHFAGRVPNCTLISGCELVTTSVYSSFLGIPVALLGSIFYLLIFLLAIFVLDQKSTRVFHVLCLLTPLGFLASLWFVFLQIFVIKALCLYCLGSAFTSTMIFISGVIGFKKSQTDKE